MTHPPDAHAAASPGSPPGPPPAAPAPPPTSAAPSAGTDPGLRRPHRGRMVAGVAAGVAEALDLDPTIVRLGMVVLTFVGGIGVPLYVAGWLLMPEEGAEGSVAGDLLSRAGL